MPHQEHLTQADFHSGLKEGYRTSWINNNSRTVQNQTNLKGNTKGTPLGKRDPISTPNFYKSLAR